MILVDTSIVVELLRSPDQQMTDVLRAEGGAICGVTRAEVLHGSRDEGRFALLSRAVLPSLRLFRG